jgi:hypothetical protein
MTRSATGFAFANIDQAQRTGATRSAFNHSALRMDTL